MMKTLAIASFAFLAFACGAPQDDIDGDSDGELGTAEEAFQAPTTPTFQFGTQTGTSRNRCTKTASGQVCNVIDHKNVGYCSDGLAFAGGMAGTTEFENNIAPAWAQLDSALTTWVIERTPFELFQNKCLDGGQSANGAVFTIHALKGAVGASGTASNDTLDYVKWTYSPVTALSEGAGVVGQYQSFFACDITFDVTDINAKFSNATFRAKAYNHLAKQAMVGCLGLGRRTFSTTVNFATSKVMFNGTSDFVLTSGEQCALNAFDRNNTTTFSNNGTCAND